MLLIIWKMYSIHQHSMGITKHPTYCVYNIYWYNMVSFGLNKNEKIIFLIFSKNPNIFQDPNRSSKDSK